MDERGAQFHLTPGHGGDCGDACSGAQCDDVQGLTAFRIWGSSASQSAAEGDVDTRGVYDAGSCSMSKGARLGCSIRGVCIDKDG